MTRQNARIILAAALILRTSAVAQGGNATIPNAQLLSFTKIGVVNIQSAIINTRDGQNDMQELEKKFDPRKNELKLLSDGIDSLKKQFETQGPKLNDEARANLSKQIASKQKTLVRAQEDAQSDFTEQQNEVVQKVLQKLLPVIAKYAKDNDLGLVMDNSKPWPEWPVLWVSPPVDITKAVVDIYNSQSVGRPSSPVPHSSPH
jgi:outer membrane protein